MKLYLEVEKVIQNEDIGVLIADIENYSGDEKKIKELIEAIVRIANIHIWETYLTLIETED